jgi:hypothetical protein
MNPEHWGLAHPSNMRNADRMISDLREAGRLDDTGRRSELALDLLRIGSLLDWVIVRSTPYSGQERALLQRAYDAISSDLRGDPHYGWEHDPKIVGLLKYIHPPGQSFRNPW